MTLDVCRLFRANPLEKCPNIKELFIDSPEAWNITFWNLADVQKCDKSVHYSRGATRTCVKCGVACPSKLTYCPTCELGVSASNSRGFRITSESYFIMAHIVVDKNGRIRIPGVGSNLSKIFEELCHRVDYHKHLQQYCIFKNMTVQMELMLRSPLELSDREVDELIADEPPANWYVGVDLDDSDGAESR